MSRIGAIARLQIAGRIAVAKLYRLSVRATILADEGHDSMAALPSTPPPAWHRHFFHRKESLRTTWKLRLSVLFLLLLTLALTRGWLSERIAQSLLCTEQHDPAEALLIENFDPTYIVFERAESLQREGVASRIFVPTASPEEGEPNVVAKGVVEVMARTARLPKFDIIPIQEIEPISLNAASQIRDALAKEHIKSVVVVAPALRSRRSALVYNTVLTPAGIRVECVPVFGSYNPENWTQTWHGVQEVAEQFLKLQYYRFWVLGAIRTVPK
jgi:hypothetical protein